MDRAPTSRTLPRNRPAIERGPLTFCQSGDRVARNVAIRIVGLLCLAAMTGCATYHPYYTTRPGDVAGMENGIPAAFSNCLENVRVQLDANVGSERHDPAIDMRLATQLGISATQQPASAQRELRLVISREWSYDTQFLGGLCRLPCALSLGTIPGYEHSTCTMRAELRMPDGRSLWRQNRSGGYRRYMWTGLLPFQLIGLTSPWDPTYRIEKELSRQLLFEFARSPEALGALDKFWTDRDWANARENDDAPTFERFIRQHPNAPHAPEAAARKEVLEKYSEEWRRTLLDPSIERLSAYCDQNPGSPYLPKARAAIQGMGEGRNIVDLLKDGVIEIEARGMGIQHVSLRVRKLTAYPVTVRVPVGSYLIASRQSAQNMVTTTESKIRLSKNDWQSILLSAACANRPRSIPDSGDTFTVQGSPHQAELARLMPILDRAGVNYATRQAAVWIVTDDASYSDLGVLVSRPAYAAFGGTRTINEPETARAMKICDEAGIDITCKRIWKDRSTIIQGLPDGELKTWLMARSPKL